MTAPETAGQAAYEAYLAHLQGADPGYGQWVKPFTAIDKHDRAAWEAAATAAIAAAAPAPAAEGGPDVCECGHYVAHHAFSDDVCAVMDCPCERPRPAPQPGHRALLDAATTEPKGEDQ